MLVEVLFLHLTTIVTTIFRDYAVIEMIKSTPIKHAVIMSSIHPNQELPVASVVDTSIFFLNVNLFST